jgi:hypothetical protein
LLTVSQPLELHRVNTAIVEVILLPIAMTGAHWAFTRSERESEVRGKVSCL